MHKILDDMHFFEGHDPAVLTRAYGSPLYVYNERIFRARCREAAGLMAHKPYAARFAVKANMNLALLRIAREEGLRADATSEGEIAALFAAGYEPAEILFVANNIAPTSEMRFAIDRSILLSLDSLSQVESFGKQNRGGRLAVRLNTGVGAGHHEKVVTGGDKTKFGITRELWPSLISLARHYDLKIVGLTQHIGSLFMTPDPYILGAKALLEAARQFDGLEFIDFGGGFGIPYHKRDNEPRLDLQALGQQLDALIAGFTADYGPVAIHTEPGRYVAAECGVLLGAVTAVKRNGPRKYIGTDVGFTVLARPMLYDAYHELAFYGDVSGQPEPATVVGNICESGDILANDRTLPAVTEGCIVAILDAGAYGAAMASNYNNRPRPAEALIRQDGTLQLTRRRDTFDDMLAPYLQI